MPEQTAFGALEVLLPGDPLSSDGYAFQYKNPITTAQLLQIGAVLHKHDAHAAMANPTVAPTVTTGSTGGTIAASTTVFVEYTLVDPQGGETLPAPLASVTTAAGCATPTGAPTLTPSFSSGTLLADTYMYAVSVTDGLGGETALGPSVSVLIPASANAEIAVSGLTAITNTSSGSSSTAGWRLWRSTDGGSTWDLMATGGHATDAFTDNGSSPGDCSVTPRTTGNTGNTNYISVTVPGGQPASAQFIKIYACTDGAFTNPCLLATLPISDATVEQNYTSVTLAAGSPPSQSTCIGGANQIDPDTDIMDWPWKSPVATFSALPSTGNADGDMRIVLATHVLYVWEAGTSTWVAGGGAVGSLIYVNDATGVPGFSGTTPNDICIDSNGEIYTWSGTAWTDSTVNIKGATGPAASSSVTVHGVTGNYTLELTDAGCVVEIDGSAGSVAITVPTNATVDFPVNTVIEICDIGTSAISITAASGVTLDLPPSATAGSSGQWATMGLRQRAIDEWVLSGNLA